MVDKKNEPKPSTFFGLNNMSAAVASLSPRRTSHSQSPKAPFSESSSSSAPPVSSLFSSLLADKAANIAYSLIGDKEGDKRALLAHGFIAAPERIERDIITEPGLKKDIRRDLTNQITALANEKAKLIIGLINHVIVPQLLNIKSDLDILTALKEEADKTSPDYQLSDTLKQFLISSDETEKRYSSEGLMNLLETIDSFLPQLTISEEQNYVAPPMQFLNYCQQDKRWLLALTKLDELSIEITGIKEKIGSDAYVTARALEEKTRIKDARLYIRSESLFAKIKKAKALRKFLLPIPVFKQNSSEFNMKLITTFSQIQLMFNEKILANSENNADNAISNLFNTVYNNILNGYQSKEEASKEIYLKHDFSKKLLNYLAAKKYKNWDEITNDLSDFFIAYIHEEILASPLYQSLSDEQKTSVGSFFPTKIVSNPVYQGHSSSSSSSDVHSSYSLPLHREPHSPRERITSNSAPSIISTESSSKPTVPLLKLDSLGAPSSKAVSFTESEINLSGFFSPLSPRHHSPTKIEGSTEHSPQSVRKQSPTTPTIDAPTTLPLSTP